MPIVVMHPVSGTLPGCPGQIPPGYFAVNASPAEMVTGDRILLGGLDRTVRHVGRGAKTGRLLVLLEGRVGAESDRWHPLTGDLPLPIWRSEPAAAHIALSTPPVVTVDLIRRVIDGLRALPVEHGPGRVPTPRPIAATSNPLVCPQPAGGLNAA
jgi:hypothetical protein